jgi:superfamily I DNA and/or RNA helicase
MHGWIQKPSKESCGNGNSFLNVYLLIHRYPEGDSEDSHSHFNDHEAKFLVNLCRYIIQQGYQPCQVTILTSYLGQMFTIRDQMTSDGEDLKQVRPI